MNSNSFVDQKDYLRSCKNIQNSMGGASQRKSSSSKVLKNNRNNRNNRNNKYIPPNKRDNKKNVNNNTFSNDKKNFPILTSSYDLKKTTDITNSTPKQNMNFASLFKKKKDKKKYDVKPGWVKISKVNNKNVYKYGRVATNNYNMDNNKMQKEVINNTFNNLIERWQNERDKINEVLEQWSPYWNEKDLREPLSDNEYESSVNDEDYENESMDYDEYDDDYYSDFDA